jgi:hypothetical protein
MVNIVRWWITCVIRFWGPINQSLLPSAATVFFVFSCDSSGWPQYKTKNPCALRAPGLVEVGGGK